MVNIITHNFTHYFSYVFTYSSIFEDLPELLPIVDMFGAPLSDHEDDDAPDKLMDEEDKDVEIVPVPEDKEFDILPTTEHGDCRGMQDATASKDGQKKVLPMP